MKEQPRNNSFDLIVIGGGPAGTCGANTAAIFGQKVALIEKSKHLGGAGINSGTVPSKTLRETALALSGWQARKLFGVDLSLRRETTIADLTFHKDHVVTTEQKRLESELSKHGVTVFQGDARFLDAHTVAVTSADGSIVSLTGEHVLIATGSVPFRPPEFPFADERVHDSDELLDIKSLPKKLAVVGAGVIGSEYASTFAALGVEVHLTDGRDALLPFLDAEVSAALAGAMATNGVNFHWKVRVIKCDVSDEKEVKLTLSSGKILECDNVLVCAGRTSKTASLNLEAAGITPGPRGTIAVDAKYKVLGASNIYAAGDVIGPPALASTSMEQARMAVCAAFGIQAKADMEKVLPTGIYTIPEVGTIGETEESAQQKGLDYLVGRFHYSNSPRGKIMGDETGFLKLIFNREDMRLIGAHVMGELATEIVHIGEIAILSESTADLFNRACFNYPSLGELYKYATYDALLQKQAVLASL